MAMDWVMRGLILAVAALANAAGAAAALPANNNQAPGFSQQQLGGAASKLVSASVGDIAVVFSRSKSHQNYALADIQWMIVPPVVLGQFYVAELAHKEQGVRAPVAAVTWAHVSPELDQRLRASGGERVKLSPTEWKSGVARNKSAVRRVHKTRPLHTLFYFARWQQASASCTVILHRSVLEGGA